MYSSWSGSAGLISRLAEVETGVKAAAQSDVEAISSLDYTKTSSEAELKEALGQFQNAIDGARFFEVATPRDGRGKLSSWGGTWTLGPL